LLDFYGGLNDLEQGIVRVLHSLSFVDDPTRILRAIRYEQRFGFQIEPRTLELLRDASELIDRVTPARIRHEVERILQEEYPERALARLADLELLARLHPELQAGYAKEWVDSRFAVLRELRRPGSASPLLAHPIERLYFGILVYHLPEPTQTTLAQRLGLRAETQRLVRGLNRIRAALPELRKPASPPSRVVAIFDEVDPAALDLIPVVCAGEQQILWFYRRYRADWQHIQPALNGNDLMALGIARGPIYRRLLSSLRAGRLDRSLQSREDELVFVRRELAGKG
jgi:tRNA nucleotidyltransferase (CCA-adding enzyme)